MIEPINDFVAIKKLEGDGSRTASGMVGTSEEYEKAEVVEVGSGYVHTQQGGEIPKPVSKGDIVYFMPDAKLYPMMDDILLLSIFDIKAREATN